MEGSASDDIVDSPSGGDSSSEENSAEKVTLRKGSWTVEEDAILKDYVTNHGEGNWKDVRKSTGLLRCGKSCRLRWTNHLRPNLKKGPFNKEEESLVVQLHDKMGNKWAQMTAHLPGRTDNDIKNFWNTRKKRLHRSGEPLYPPDVRVEMQNETQKSPESDTVPNNVLSCHSLMEATNTVFPEFKIERPLNPELYNDMWPSLNIPTGNILPQCPSASLSFSNLSSVMHPKGPCPSQRFSYVSSAICPRGLSPSSSFSYISSAMPSQGLGPSSNFDYITPTMRPLNQLQEPDITPHGLRDTASSTFIGNNNYEVLRRQQQQHQAHELPPLPEIYFGAVDELPLCFNPGSRTLIDGNGNTSTSVHNVEAPKLGLPSLQRSVSHFSFGPVPRPYPFLKPPEAKPDELSQHTLLNRLDATEVENCHQNGPNEKITDDLDGFFDVPGLELQHILGDPIAPIGPSHPNSLNHFTSLAEYFAESQVRTLEADPIEHSTGLNSNIVSNQLDISSPEMWTNLENSDFEQSREFVIQGEAMTAFLGGDDAHHQLPQLKD